MAVCARQAALDANAPTASRDIINTRRATIETTREAKDNKTDSLPNGSTALSDDRATRLGPLARAVDIVGRVVAWLGLGLALLLFAQWPLRDGLQRSTTVLNDVAQIAFALVAACGVAFALVHDRHVRLALVAERWSLRRRAAIDAIGHAVFVLPWLVVIAFGSRRFVLDSIAGFERFPETGSPGYWIIRAAIVLLIVLTTSASCARIASAWRTWRG